MRAFLAWLAIATALCSPAFGAYREECRAYYMDGAGSSQGYRVECVYAAGEELNAAVGAFSYRPLATYAVIFWAPGEATIIEIDGLATCAPKATRGCLSWSLGGIEGTDQSGRSWRICTQTNGICLAP
jgi:hypothetical protein